jgi:hypothetical protein
VPDRAEDEYADLLDRARRNPVVVGVVVFGSRAAGPFAQDISDVDCFVVVDGSAEEARAWQTPHGSLVEAWAMTFDAFRAHAEPGSSTAWNRPALIRARVDLDKLDGEIGQIVDRKRRLDSDEARALIDDALDGAINSIYRALRNLEAGRIVGWRMDALESLGPLLTAVSPSRVGSGRSTNGSSSSSPRSRCKRPPSATSSSASRPSSPIRRPNASATPSG